MFGKNKVNEEDPKHEKTESKAKEKKENAGGRKGSNELDQAIGQMPKKMGQFKGQY